jgi:phospholipase/carboxylesterase
VLRDYRISPSAGGKAGHAVIFLHGLGDSGQGGLLSIGGMWQRDLPADTEFFCPDAPFPYDMTPPPDTGGPRQWFSMKIFSPPAMLQGARTAARYLNEYIDHVLTTRGLASNRLALVGFSQGTIMALYAALRRADQIAGIVGYSGLLVGGENLSTDKKSAPPVLLVHGTADEVVPFGLMGPSEAMLQAAGVPVTTVTCPGTGHSIDETGLAEGLRFLKKILV